jgi:hypothetical protein
VKTTKCITLILKLPPSIIEKYKGIEARGVCKIIWKSYSEIHLKNRSVNLEHRGGHTVKLDNNFIGCELTALTGKILISLIKQEGHHNHIRNNMSLDFNRSLKIQSKSMKKSILFFHSLGYNSALRTLSVGLRLEKSLATSYDSIPETIDSLSSNAGIRLNNFRGKNSYRYAKSFFEILSYLEV